MSTLSHSFQSSSTGLVDVVAGTGVGVGADAGVGVDGAGDVDGVDVGVVGDVGDGTHCNSCQNQIQLLLDTWTPHGEEGIPSE